jgi:S-adenosylmethionine decarboxylase
MKNVLFNSFLSFLVVSSLSAHEAIEAVTFDDSNLSKEEQIHLPTGRHVIADLHGCQSCHYTDDIENILREAATQASATVLSITVIPFDPVLVNGQMVQGMTGTVVLSESHIAFHTWPENGFVACDIFTCGTNALPEKGLEVLLEYFKPQETNIRILGRGMAAKN